MPAESAVIVVSLLVLCMASFDRVLCIDNDALWRGSQVQIIDGFNDALVASNYHHLFVDNQR
jgi:alpha-N-acetylglucosamine transferase